MVIIQALREGRLRIGTRGDISIPSSVRALSGLQPGQDVLLAALTNHGILIVHSAGTVARLLGRVHRRILGDLR